MSYPLLCKYLHKIGNYTSQYYANIVLNELDYYVKYELKIKYYCSLFFY